MSTTAKVCTCILIGILCLFTNINLQANSVYTYPTEELFGNIQVGTDKTRFVEEATYFTLNKGTLAQIHQQKLETMTLQIPFGATKKLEAKLTKASFFAEDFKVTVHSGGTHNTLSYSPSLFYRGAISGVENAMIVLNFHKETISGVLSLNGESYNIGKYGKDNSDTFVLYKERNINASNPFACSTEDPEELIVTREYRTGARSDNTVSVYVECDHDLYKANGFSAQATTDFATGLFNVVSAIYANDDITVELSEIKVWASQDPYPTTSAKAARDAFGASLNGDFNGDVAHLLSNYKVNGTVPNGGSANIDALCDKEKAVGYTNITTSYKQYPTYSWTAYAVSHEIGHNLGSAHTHSCLWPTGPIDNCWCPEGDCDQGDEPASTGGTVMSYCHLNPQWTNDCDLSASNPGINLASGFGDLPGALIRSRIKNASCLGSTAGGVVYVFQANANVKDEACNQQNGRVTLTVSYGQSPYTYNWSNGEKSKDLTNVSAGDYSCTITDATGKTTTVNVTVNGSQPFFVSAGADQIIGCAEPIVSLDGSESRNGFSYDYKWTSLSGNLYGNTTKEIISVSEPGFYVLTVSNEDTGCIVKDTVEVTEDFTSPALTLSAEELSCDKSNTEIRTTGSPSIATYQWSGPNGFSSIVARPVVSEAGSYVVVVTGTNGCTTEKMIEVVRNTTVPAINAEGGTISCGNNTTQLSANSATAIAYNWEGPNGFTSSSTNPTVDQAGVYALKVTAENGCTNQTTVSVVSDTEAPAITAQGGTITCGNATAQLTATTIDNVTYSWTGPNNFQSTEQNPVVETAGVYNLLITNGTGCTNETSVTVTRETAEPKITAKGSVLDCNRPTATFVIVTDEVGLTYSWKGPNGFASNEPTPTVSTPGVYRLTAQKGAGCTTTLDVLIEAKFAEPHVAIKGEDLTCANNKITLKGLSNDNIQSFAWEHNGNIISNNQEVDIIEAGIYSVTAMNEYGCTTTEVFTVNANTELPSIELKANDLTCANPSTTLKLVSTANDLTINWTGPENFSSIENNPTVTLPGTYQVRVTNATGCSNTASITVNQTGTSTIEFAATTALSCEQEVVTIDASASSLKENIAVEWTTEDGNIIHQINELMISVNEPGTYALTIRDLDTECVTIETVNVVAASAISARIDNDKVLTCENSSLTLTAAIGNNTENAVYNWVTENGNIISNRDAKEIVINAPGEYTLFVTDTITGCSDATFASVREAARPEARIATPEMLTCTKLTTTLSGEGSVVSAAAKVEWSRNGEAISNSNSLFLTVNAAGTYQMTITDTVNQCQTMAEMEVVQHEVPQVAVSNLAQDACAKGEGSLTLAVTTNGAYEIKWNNGETGSKIENLSAGIYTATVTDAVGCQVVISRSIQATAPIALSDIAMTPITCHDSENGSITVELKGGNFPYETQWSNGETGLAAVNLSAGVHSLEVVDAKGCVSSFEFPVTAPNALEAEVKVMENDVMVEVAGGSPDYNFLWSDGTTESYGSNFSAGSHEVTIEDANGCSVSKTFEIDGITTSLKEEVGQDLQVQTFPNPTTDYFRVQKNLKSTGSINLSVFSASGMQMIASSTKGNTIDTTINTSDWKPGTYFLRVVTKEGMSVKKIQVVKL